MFKNKKTGYSAFNKANVIMSIIGFLMLFSALGNSQDDFTEPETILVSAAIGIILFIIVLIRNFKTGNIFKAIISTVVSFVGAGLIAILFLILVITGNSDSIPSSKRHESDEGSYTDSQNQQAKAHGYSNGKDAEMSGRSWNGTDWV